MDNWILSMNGITKVFPGVKVVPTMLLQPVTIDKSNTMKTLLAAKYYTAAQMQ